MLRGGRAAWGLVVGLVLIGVAFALPHLGGWEVYARRDRMGAPPTHGYWEPKVALATVPAVLLAALAVWRGAQWAQRWSWRWLLVISWATGVAWMLSLALVDGEPGLTRMVANDSEYMATARQIGDVPAMLSGYVDRIPFDHPDNWPIHIAGHPPGAVLLFIPLARVGLGDLAIALVTVGLAATVPVAVLVTLRLLGVDRLARTAAPFLVMTPSAVYSAVSADAIFAALAAWGLAALAASATADTRRSLLGWGVVAGLLLGWSVMASYGLPLLGVLALAVLWLARSWWPLPVAAATSLALVLGFAALGFAWWEAYPVLVERYWDGMASDRPWAYWVWGNLAALLVSGGPLLAAALPHAARRWSGQARTLAVLAAAAVVIVVAADLSRMSKAEVERIWLPFVPWLTLAMALLPDRWRRPGLALQVTTALVVQHLLYTSW